MVHRGGGINSLQLHVVSSHLDGKCSPLGAQIQIHFIQNPYESVFFIMIYLSHGS